MKKQYRFLSVLLIAALLAAVPAAVQAEYDAGVSVYIPNKIERLHLPDMPEYIALFTRTQSIATYGNPKDPTDPCPILPVSEPDIELFFSEQPEWAAVLWSEGIEYINVNEAGYARVSSAGHKLQPGIVSGTMVVKDENGKEKRVWAATTADHKAGDPVPQVPLHPRHRLNRRKRLLPCRKQPGNLRLFRLQRLFRQLRRSPLQL